MMTNDNMKRSLMIAVLLAIAAVILILIDRAQAQGQVSIYGAGVQSCGKWLDERRTPIDWLEEGQWVLGYVSAAGEFLNLRDTDSRGISAWVDNYCRDNPLKSIGNAAMALVKELAQ
jgi:hypothetical protein